MVLLKVIIIKRGALIIKSPIEIMTNSYKIKIYSEIVLFKKNKDDY
jgi:hypothetical protein